jgi:hypothetical protein
VLRSLWLFRLSTRMLHWTPIHLMVFAIYGINVFVVVFM